MRTMEFSWVFKTRLFQQIKELLISEYYIRSISCSFPTPQQTREQIRFKIAREEILLSLEEIVENKEDFEFILGVFVNEQWEKKTFRFPKTWHTLEDNVRKSFKFIQVKVTSIIEERELELLMNLDWLYQTEYQEHFIWKHITHSLFGNMDINEFYFNGNRRLSKKLNDHTTAMKKNFHHLILEHFHTIEHVETAFKRLYYESLDEQRYSMFNFKSSIFALNDEEFNRLNPDNNLFFVEIFKLNEKRIVFFKKVNFDVHTNSASIIKMAITNGEKETLEWFQNVTGRFEKKYVEFIETEIRAFL